MNVDENYINSILEESNNKMPRLRKNKIYLSDYQISVLNSFGINYDKYKDMKSIIFEVENILNEFDDPDLEKVSQELSEFNYYNNTNK